jgi:hypothetical protein
VEGTALEVEGLGRSCLAHSFLSGAKSSEVLCCNWDGISEELEGDSSVWALVDADVEENSGVALHFSAVQSIRNVFINQDSSLLRFPRNVIVLNFLIS